MDIFGKANQKAQAIRLVNEGLHCLWNELRGGNWESSTPDWLRVQWTNVWLNMSLSIGLHTKGACGLSFVAVCFYCLSSTISLYANWAPIVAHEIHTKAHIYVHIYIYLLLLLLFISYTVVLFSFRVSYCVTHIHLMHTQFASKCDTHSIVYAMRPSIPIYKASHNYQIHQ